MQEKTWYYEKWVGRQASFSPSRYVKDVHEVLSPLTIEEKFGFCDQEKYITAYAMDNIYRQKISKKDMSHHII